MEIGNLQALPGGERFIGARSAVLCVRQDFASSHATGRYPKRTSRGSLVQQEFGGVSCRSRVPALFVVKSALEQSRVDPWRPVRRWRYQYNQMACGTDPNGGRPVRHTPPGTAGRGSPRGRSAPHKAAMPVIAATNSDRMMPARPVSPNAATIPCAAWYPAIAAGRANATPTQARSSGDRAWPISNWPMASADVAAASPAIREISRPAPLTWTHSAAAPPHQSGRAWTASDHSKAPARQAQTRITMAAINKGVLSRRRGVAGRTFLRLHGASEKPPTLHWEHPFDGKWPSGSRRSSAACHSLLMPRAVPRRTQPLRRPPLPPQRSSAPQRLAALPGRVRPARRSRRASGRGLRRRPSPRRPGRCTQ